MMLLSIGAGLAPIFVFRPRQKFIPSLSQIESPQPVSRLSNRASDREATTANVAADGLDDFIAAREPGRVLVAGDVGGAVEQRFRDAGWQVTVWNRLAWDNKAAAAWPAEGQFDTAYLRQPRGWAGFEAMLHALAARLPTGAPLWIAGGNDEGVTSAHKRLIGLFDETETVTIKRRVRLLRSLRTGLPADKGNLEDWRETVRINIPGVPDPVDLVSYPGLFAHGRLDAGTECLLQVLPELAEGTAVLDFGCGGGVISRALIERGAKVRLTMLDIDALALHAARQNVPDAELVLGDGLDALGSRERYGLIISNPPLHRGKDEDFGMIEALIAGTKKYLKLRGSLVLVTQRTAGVGKAFQEAFGHSELLLETPQFQVWKGTPK